MLCGLENIGFLGLRVRRYPHLWNSALEGTGENFRFGGPRRNIPIMTRKEAIRRLENLALEEGHNRKHYIKRALVEFLENRESLLRNEREPRTNDIHPVFAQLAPRLNKPFN